MSINLETMKVNVTTVVSIVIASFMLYFFISALIAAALIEAKKYAIDLDIERNRGVISMYRTQQADGVAKPGVGARIASLEANVAQRIQDKKDLAL